MFCEKCGEEHTEEALFCANCVDVPLSPGDAIADTLPEPLPNPYTRLGGWMMFIVLTVMIGTISSVLGWVGSLRLLDAISDQRLVEVFFNSWELLTLSLLAVTSSLLCIVYIVQIIRRSPAFFLIFHIRVLLSIAAHIIAIIAIGDLEQESGVAALNLTLLIFEVFVWSCYYVASDRVATYMGSLDYLHRNPASRLFSRLYSIIKDDEATEKTHQFDDISRIGSSEMSKTTFRNTVMVVFAIAIVVLNVNESINSITRQINIVESRRNFGFFTGIRDLGAWSYYARSDENKYVVYFVDLETTDVITRTTGFFSVSDYGLTRDQLQRIILNGSTIFGWTPQPPELVGGLDAEQQKAIAVNFSHYEDSHIFKEYIEALERTFNHLKREDGVMINEFESIYNFERIRFSSSWLVVPLEVMIYLIEFQGNEVR